MTRFLSPIFALGLGLAAGPTFARAPGPVEQRIDNQQQRINNGVATGELTKGEAARDEAHVEQDQAIRNKDLADHGGHLTGAERAHLDAKLNHNRHRVYATKHNAKVAAPGH